MKKVVIVLMSVILPEDNTVQPLWDNTNVIDCTVGFIEGTGRAESLVYAKFGATSIKTDIYVYALGDNAWIYVAEAHGTKNAITSVSTCLFDAILNETYRVDYTFTVTRNGTDEVITRTVYETYSE